MMFHWVGVLGAKFKRNMTHGQKGLHFLQNYTVLKQAQLQSFVIFAESRGMAMVMVYKGPRWQKGWPWKSWSVEEINAVDCLSLSLISNTNVDDNKYPELDNKIVYTFNTLTLQLIVQYYYCFVRVDSERGRSLLGIINHQLATASIDNDLIMEQSIFVFEGLLYCTLSYLNSEHTITCVKHSTMETSMYLKSIRSGNWF